MDREQVLRAMADRIRDLIWEDDSVTDLSVRYGKLLMPDVDWDALPEGDEREVLVEKHAEFASRGIMAAIALATYELTK